MKTYKSECETFQRSFNIFRRLISINIKYYQLFLKSIIIIYQKDFARLFLIIDMKCNKKMNILNGMAKIISAFFEMSKIKLFIFFFEIQHL